MSKPLVRRQRTTHRKKPAASLADARLTALLMYLTGTNQDDDGRIADRFAHAHDAARRMLSSRPLTSAFSLQLRRPELNELIYRNILQDMRRWLDATETRRVLERVQGDRWRESESVSRLDLQQLFLAHQDHGVLAGACLMYELLDGGAR